MEGYGCVPSTTCGLLCCGCFRGLWNIVSLGKRTKSGARRYWLVGVVINHIDFAPVLVVVDRTMCPRWSRPLERFGLPRVYWHMHIWFGRRQIRDFVPVVLVLRGISALPRRTYRGGGSLNLGPDVSGVVPRPGVWILHVVDHAVAVVLGPSEP